MSKKSFKQLQNRLYREIKRRIQAESTPNIYKRNQVEIVHRPVVQWAYVSSMPLCGVDERETQEIARYLMRTDVAKVLAEELATSQYMKREIHIEPDENGNDILYVHCRIDICKPTRGD